MNKQIGINETFPLTAVSPLLNDGVNSFTYTLSTEVDNSDKSLYCAVNMISLPYVIWNIHSDYGNNTLRYSYNGGLNWVIVTLANGMYSTQKLNAVIQATMQANGHWDAATSSYYISINVSDISTRVMVTLSNSYRLDLENPVGFLRTSRLGEMLGFIPGVTTYVGVNPTAYTAGEGYIIANGITTATNLPIVNSVKLSPMTAIVFHSNIVAGTSLGATSDSTDVLYTFIPPTASNPGDLLVEKATHLIWRKISETSIKNIRIWTTNNYGVPVTLRGDPITVELLFTRR